MLPSGSKASYQVYREHQDQALRARKGAVLTLSPNLIPRWGRDGKRPEVRFIEQKARFSASEGQKSHHTLITLRNTNLWTKVERVTTIKGLSRKGKPRFTL